jgi:hypothetical protein
LDATTANVASVEQKAGLDINVSTFMATLARCITRSKEVRDPQSSSFSSGSQNSHTAHSSSATLRGFSNGRTQRQGLVGSLDGVMPKNL